MSFFGKGTSSGGGMSGLGSVTPFVSDSTGGLGSASPGLPTLNPSTGLTHFQSQYLTQQPLTQFQKQYGNVSGSSQLPINKGGYAGPPQVDPNSTDVPLPPSLSGGQPIVASSDPGSLTSGGHLTPGGNELTPNNSTVQPGEHTQYYVGRINRERPKIVNPRVYNPIIGGDPAFIFDHIPGAYYDQNTDLQYVPYDVVHNKSQPWLPEHLWKSGTQFRPELHYSDYHIASVPTIINNPNTSPSWTPGSSNFFSETDVSWRRGGDQGSSSFGFASGGLVRSKTRGYRDGGPVAGAPPPGSAPSPSQPPVNYDENMVLGAMMALDPESNISDSDRKFMLKAFEDEYGEEAMNELLFGRVSPNDALASDGTSDSIPALIDGEQPAALSEGEFVVPADVVSGLGNGSTESGARRLMQMIEEIRARNAVAAQRPAPGIPAGADLNDPMASDVQFNNGGKVKKSKPKKGEVKEPSKLNELSSIADSLLNPTLPPKYNPLSDNEVQLKIRPSLNPRGMHRFGVTLPFDNGGFIPAADTPNFQGSGIYPEGDGDIDLHFMHRRIASQDREDAARTDRLKEELKEHDEHTDSLVALRDGYEMFGNDHLASHTGKKFISDQVKERIGLLEEIKRAKALEDKNFERVVLDILRDGAWGN